MRPTSQLSVPGGTLRLVSRVQLEALQLIVAELGAETYPIFLRLGGSPRTSLQPVTARALLKEIEKFTGALDGSRIPGVQFFDPAGKDLGSIYRREIGEADTISVAATPEGISVIVQQFPPPVGFRSRPGLKAGLYECLFERLTLAEGEAYVGYRTAAMGGSGAPVALPGLPLPPATRWDIAHTAGRPAIARVEWVLTATLEVYRDLLHAFTSACDESLRLRAPLLFVRD